MLSAPMLAALAIGLAETASAAPVDPQPSVPGAGSKSASALSHPSASIEPGLAGVSAAPTDPKPSSVEHGLAAVGLHPTTSLAPNVGKTDAAPSSAPLDAKAVADMEHVMAELHEFTGDITADLQRRSDAQHNAMVEISQNY